MRQNIRKPSLTQVYFFSFFLFLKPNTWQTEGGPDVLGRSETHSQEPPILPAPPSFVFLLAGQGPGGTAAVSGFFLFFPQATGLILGQLRTVSKLCAFSHRALFSPKQIRHWLNSAVGRWGGSLAKRREGRPEKERAKAHRTEWKHHAKATPLQPAQLCP